MRLFGRKGAREAVRPVLLRVAAGIPFGEWPRSYEAQVREAYLGNAIAQRAVRLVAEAVGGTPIVANEGHAQAARLIGATSAGQSLIETLAMYLLLHGNGYVHIALDSLGAPAELFALRPERVTIEPGADGWPAAYRYKAGERVMRMPARDGTGKSALIHVKAAHPADDHYGLGCLGAAAGAVAIHNAAARWNKALLDNAARPSGALVYDPGEEGATLSGEQFARLKAELEESFQGAGNAGRPMLLEGGLRWQAMSLSPADMDFVGLKAAAAREIALAFGVPPLLLGLPGDNQYANYAEANRALWRQAVLPLTEKIVRGLEQGLRAWWPGLALRVDRDAIPALSEDRERLWAQVGATDFLSAEEKRAVLGLNPQS
jgi:HK97 family phage portal protein